MNSADCNGPSRLIANSSFHDRDCRKVRESAMLGFVEYPSIFVKENKGTKLPLNQCQAIKFFYLEFQKIY